MKEPSKALLQDYMELLRADANRVFPGNDFVSINIMHGRVSVSAFYPGGSNITETILKEKAE